MALFTINYRNIEDSIKKADRTANALNEYEKDIDEIARDCNRLGTPDPRGYINTAANLAGQKARRARDEKEKFKTLSRQLVELESFARSQDQAVAHDIDVEVTEFLGKRSLGQGVCDFFYDLFVGFLDRVAGIPVVGEYIAQAIRKAGNWVSDTFRKTTNYFKYGDGKYIWNGVRAIVGAVVAIASAFVAVVTFMAAAPAAAMFALVGMIAATAYAILKAGDATVEVDNNIKAFSLSQQYKKSTENKDKWWDTSRDQGSLSASRYYGSISGVKDWIDKTDFGGAGVNNTMEIAGGIYSFVENTAAIVSSACEIGTSLANAQYMKTDAGEWIKGADGKPIMKDGSFANNIWTDIKENLGIKYEKDASGYVKDKGKLKIKEVDFDFKEMFIPKFFGDYDSKFDKVGVSLTGFEKSWLKTSKLLKNVMDFSEDIDNVSGSGEDIIENLEGAYGIASNFGVIDSIFGNLEKNLKIGKDIGKDIVDHFFEQKESYSQYIDRLAFAGVNSMGGR